MNRLRELRKEKKLTLKEVSSQLEQNNLKISPDALAKYERGDREPKLETWQKLADFFGVSVPYLQGISKVKDVDAFDDFKSFLDYLSKIRKLPDRYSIETDELLAFYAENDRIVFKLLGDVFLKLTRTKRTHKALEKAVKDISENSDIQDISEINSIMLDVFVIMLQSETNVEKSIKARKKIIDIVETHRSLERKDI